MFEPEFRADDGDIFPQEDAVLLFKGALRLGEAERPARRSADNARNELADMPFLHARVHGDSTPDGHGDARQKLRPRKALLFRKAQEPSPRHARADAHQSALRLPLAKAAKSNDNAVKKTVARQHVRPRAEEAVRNVLLLQKREEASKFLPAFRARPRRGSPAAADRSMPCKVEWPARAKAGQTADEIVRKRQAVTPLILTHFASDFKYFSGIFRGHPLPAPPRKADRAPPLRKTRSPCAPHCF